MYANIVSHWNFINLYHNCFDYANIWPDRTLIIKNRQLKDDRLLLHAMERWISHLSFQENHAWASSSLQNILWSHVLTWQFTFYFSVSIGHWSLVWVILDIRWVETLTNVKIRSFFHTCFLFQVCMILVILIVRCWKAAQLAAIWIECICFW